MQWKLPQRSRFAARFHEWAMRRGFPLLRWLAPRLPRWVLFAGGRLVMAAVFAVYRAPLAEIEKNLARVLDEPAGSRRVKHARRRMVHNLAYYWVDLFRYSQLPYERVKELVADVRGEERMREIAGEGRGVVLITAHLGNWELGGCFMRELGLPLSVVYVRDQSPTAEAFRGLFRGLIEMEEIAIEPGTQFSSLPVLRALSAGKVVAVQGDRDTGERGVPVPFFGAPAPFPLGPMLLARITGAVLVPVFVVYDEKYRFEIEFGEPIDPGLERDRDAAVRGALEAWVAALESAVSRWPDQWYSFFDYWTQPMARRPEPAERLEEAV